MREDAILKSKQEKIPSLKNMHREKFHAPSANRPQQLCTTTPKWASIFDLKNLTIATSFIQCQLYEAQRFNTLINICHLRRDAHAHQRN